MRPSSAELGRWGANMTITPRVLPCDVLDVLIAVPVGTFQVTALFALPALIVGTTISSAAGLLTFVFLYAVSLLFMVRTLEIEQDGLHFRRVLGSPKVLLWTQILSIDEAPRWELVFRGWLWPLFPARELTACLSAKHHFRIKWQGGFCYYPPRNVDEFKSAVTEFMKSRAPTNGSSVFLTCGAPLAGQEARRGSESAAPLGYRNNARHATPLIQQEKSWHWKLRESYGSKIS